MIGDTLYFKYIAILDIIMIINFTKWGYSALNKKSLSERDICTKFITPAIQAAGWDIKKQVREEYSFTDGRVIVRGNLTTRGQRKRADYMLYHKPNLPIAIIEAKDNKHTMGAGMQQAINYGDILQVPFVYSSNGDGFIEHDMLTGKERELTLAQFPSPEELWKRYKSENSINEEQEQLITQPYHFSSGAKSPRYYQLNAINRTIEAIAKGQDRILLVMATGTGKTYTAFQIIYRLWKMRKAKKILFLADRNILVDQTMTNDFKPFDGVMTKIENKKMDSSYEVYLALYQQLSGGSEQADIFKQFSPDFFDLIVIDECHRGSAKEDSNWRRILEYFSSAIQLGLTATPKETKETSNISYFGEPVYTYSLKQGIDDGFLAPYKVVRISIDKDLEGYRPTKGQYDKYGYLIEDREYNLTDFDKNLVLEKRTELVAKKVTEFLKKTDRFAKTIVFCIDIDHAERMRQALVNENADLVKQDSRYIMRITGDNPEGKAQLDNFIDPESLYPTIVTTSKLLTTGVDCKTCKYFSSAIQLGLTATPKETKETSNISYFGEPVYTYSLKQGIDDGFLAPYKVIRISIDKDLEGYRPTKGQYDKYGYLIEDREYNLTDFDKNLVLEKRTELVAKKVTEFLKKTDRFAKTIVFCIDIDHAERMRQALVNENADLVKQDSRYVMRITGDNPEGKAQLDNFIDPESLYPTIVTTSKLLTTGVDCKTCKLIVLDANIGSMTEFKQIVGRGTRLNPDHGKEYFTIMDFRNNSRKFADPDFDGDPVQFD